MDGISGAFKLIISECAGFGVENFAEGVIEDIEPNTPFDIHGGFVSDMYRRLDISYAYGLPQGSWMGTKASARSSLYMH